MAELEAMAEAGRVRLEERRVSVDPLLDAECAVSLDGAVARVSLTHAEGPGEEFAALEDTLTLTLGAEGVRDVRVSDAGGVREFGHGLYPDHARAVVRDAMAALFGGLGVEIF